MFTFFMNFTRDIRFLQLNNKTSVLAKYNRYKYILNDFILEAILYLCVNLTQAHYANISTNSWIDLYTSPLHMRNRIADNIQCEDAMRSWTITSSLCMIHWERHLSKWNEGHCWAMQTESKQCLMCKMLICIGTDAVPLGSVLMEFVR